jgi:transposase
MTKPQVEVITSVQRRRRWSCEEKEERIVAAALEPVAAAFEVANRDSYEPIVSPRQQFCERI